MAVNFRFPKPQCTTLCNLPVGICCEEVIGLLFPSGGPCSEGTIAAMRTSIMRRGKQGTFGEDLTKFRRLWVSLGLSNMHYMAPHVASF